MMKQFLAVSILFIGIQNCAYAEIEKLISVSGQCIKTVTPDRASIQVFAETRDSELKTALKRATIIYEKIRSEVKKMGLENLELTSTDYRLEEIVEWEKDHRVSKGFRARLGLMIETASMEKMGDVISFATKEGAKEVGALNTFLSPKAQQREQFNCLEEATRDAKLKAERMASGAGTSLGGIHSISEQTSFPNFPRPYPMAGARMAMGASVESDSASPGVEAGKQELRVTVNAQFLIK